jgi:hypothetical protein
VRQREAARQPASRAASHHGVHGAVQHTLYNELAAALLARSTDTPPQVGRL